MMIVMNRNNILLFISIERHRIFTDGKGVTTLVASYGCPLKCKFCINEKCLKFEMKDKCVNMSPKEFYERVKIDELYF